VYINGDMEHRVPHNLNVSFNYVEGESLIMAIKGLAVSSGSACTSASLSRPTCARAERRAGAQLDPLYHRPLHDRSRHRFRGRPAEIEGPQIARTVAPVGYVQGRDRHRFDPMGSPLTPYSNQRI
jgi:hypothetical protein